jgi:hypothetical protein
VNSSGRSIERTLGSFDSKSSQIIQLSATVHFMGPGVERRNSIRWPFGSTSFTDWHTTGDTGSTSRVFRQTAGRSELRADSVDCLFPGSLSIYVSGGISSTPSGWSIQACGGDLGDREFFHVDRSIVTQLRTAARRLRHERIRDDVQRTVSHAREASCWPRGCNHFAGRVAAR